MERYESLGLVGEGSYGTVLKCRHRDSGRLVAIKKFMDSDDDRTVKKIALREIKLLRQLRHDNLVNLLEVWKRRRRWYLVFEFVDRTLLDDLEQNPGGLDLNTSRGHLYQILRATAFCHQQNVIHRDIKPENILISQGGVVKLCDFGFARAVGSPSQGAAHTDYVATRWYRAPELLVGDTHYGKPVDVWAVGCLLIEMLTGQPLFPGDSDLDQIHHIVRCLGNLMAQHQELFCRNPVFSGVRLPECLARVSLKQRFPVITPAALDLAQCCLEMDPGERAQCSELMEHLLFTHDSFPVRFLEELNAKIQRAQRENSTLPKINKTPRLEKEETNEPNHKGKNKKPLDNMDVDTDKVDKTKGKPPTKISKCNRNTSEPLTSTKPFDNVGRKIQGQSFISWKKSKEKSSSRGGLRKDIGISKTPVSDAPKQTKLAHAAKDNPTEAAISKHAQRVTPENLKDKDCDSTDHTGLDGSEKNFIRTTKSEQELEKSCSNKKVFKNSQSVQLVTKPTNTSKHQGDKTKTTTGETRLNSPNVLPTSPKPSKTVFSFNPKPYKNTMCLPMTSSLTPDLHSQSHTAFQEPIVLQKGFSYPTMSKLTLASMAPSKDGLSIKTKHKTLKSNLLIEEATNSLQITKVSSSHYKEKTVSAEQRLSLTEIVTESQRAFTSDKTAPLKPSDKENQTDINHSESATTAFHEESNKEKSSNSSHLAFVVKTLKAHHPKPLFGETKIKSGSFSEHIGTTMTPNDHKATNLPQKGDAKNNTADLKCLTPELKISTIGIVCPIVDAADLNEFELKGPPPSPPPPPPPPSSSPLLLPPTSTCLTASFAVVGIGGSVAGDPHSHQVDCYPGTIGLRFIDKHFISVQGRQAQPFVSILPAGSSPFQANVTKAPLRTRDGTNIRFPPVHLQNQSNPTVPKDKPFK
ncbi:cyclin-dependent kinase-like 3 isoform X2 [Gouania willdenowi]|uniref:Cyclin-dependent kinase-like 2 n=2 Tax=Gouania willdenowi TaxID=441366 RepID=A0A8C5H3M6_GOUWI|nr:cyclin-dependent kinase-like 3 isoform X2 [Gouania willdenowi]XP_028330615.1 cyclin-dependent kinase-like 3 isoform X2 [Gouania willdenowi]